MIGFKLIDNYANLNHFDVVEQKEFTPNQETDLYFQLCDVKGLRYLPPISAVTVTVTFENIDSSHSIITRAATQVIPLDDRSIWKVSIVPGEVIAAGSMNVTLTESSVVKQLPAFSQLTITPTGSGRYFC